MDSDEYRIPAGIGEATLVEKRSRFIASVVPAFDEAAALAHIATIRKKHWDASHNVHAYIIRNGPVRYSDDGEPQGTSGMPTLGVFQKTGIFNVCCVVTRYYGGILLGAGGLVRAYSAAARLALDDAGEAVVRRWRQVLVACPYPLFEQLRGAIEGAGGVVESSDYGVDVVLEALIPEAETRDFLGRVADLGAGRIEPELLDVVYRAAGT